MDNNINSTTTVCVWGGTGNGKSSIANLLAGSYFEILEANTRNYSQLFVGKQSVQEIFKTSADTKSVTQETYIHDGFWFGDKKYDELRIIDTPGLGDSRGPIQDGKHIADMINKLKTIEPGVNLFLLVFNSQQPRFDETLIELIRIFKKMFGESIWNNVAVVFTKWSGDDKSKRKRIREYGDNPELKKEEIFKQSFKDIVQADINCFFFVDCDPDMEPEEASDTIENMIRIKTIACGKSPFNCKDCKMVDRDIIEEQNKRKKAEEQNLKREYEARMKAQQEVEKYRQLKIQEAERYQQLEIKRQQESKAREIAENNKKVDIQKFEKVTLARKHLANHSDWAISTLWSFTYTDEEKPRWEGQQHLMPGTIRKGEDEYSLQYILRHCKACQLANAYINDNK